MNRPEFTWGVATSAYQIEGGRRDGKGDSIWDVFAHQPGRTLDGATGDVACDHYHRFAEDIDLMRNLGVDAYRFSIAWTRVLPDGTGRVEPRGLDFYNRLVDGLLEAGITPWVTLYHWDLPQVLQEAGGWVERSTADAFAEYAHVVADHLGDRVTHWITHNEPWVATVLGHVDGVFAPGIQDWNRGLRAGHHILLSHGRAVDVIRSQVPGARVGIALDCRPSRPATSRPADLAANRHFDGFRNRWFFDPVFGKGYPRDMVDRYSDRGRLPSGLDFVHPGDMEAIAAEIDFVGINYYTSITIAAPDDESEDNGVAPGANPPPGHTDMGWEITPEALTDFLVRLRDEYAPNSIVITENGASFDYPLLPDGTVDDRRRVAYLESHLQAVEEAISRGVPVDGYFVWSLLDNMEWALGYSQRFGIVHVDRETLERIPKASFSWLRSRIAAAR